MQAISLFTGAGGLDLGCEAAGFLTTLAVEHDEVARQSMALNQGLFPLLDFETCLLDDILDIDFSAALERAGHAPGEVDLVHGGPPCTPFSKSGYWLAYKRAGNDPKASLLDYYADAVGAIRPKAFLMENVYGLAYGNQNRKVFTRFQTRMREHGYSFDYKILLAADFGVPQLRQRLICVGIRTDLLDVPPDFFRFPWPDPTHTGPHETRRAVATNLPPHRTAAEAFATLTREMNPPEDEEVIAGTYADCLAEIPPGDNYLYLTAHRGHPDPKFTWRSRYWTFLLKLHPDRPASTIQGQPGPWVGPFHWDNRRLRVAEVKRLMEFPDEYKLAGSRRQQQLQLGNAVPPRLAFVVATALRAELTRLDAPMTTAELAA
jgi:DNA (cytosine-5)-methyltransferase 1